MTINFKNPKVVLSLVLGGLFLASLIFLLWPKSPKLPPLKSSVPADGAVSVALASPVTFVFDVVVSLADFSLSSTPSLKWTLSQPNSNTILASRSPAFQPSTTYSLSLSWRNQPLTALSFTTIKAQVDPLLLQQMEEELARDYPLANFTPYETSLYRVVYLAPLVLEITLKNPNLTSEEAIADIRRWVTSKGGDATAHTYTVTTP